LGRNIIESGVIGVPRGLKSIFAGEFRLTADGTPMGTLVARNSSAWGLGPYFRRRGGEESDCLLLVLNLATREAKIALGDDNLVERARGGRLEEQPLVNEEETRTPEHSTEEDAHAVDRPTLIPVSLDGVSIRPVPGKDKSQVEIRVLDRPGVRAVAHDKGQRKGFWIEIFDPHGSHNLVHSPPGLKRAGAIDLAVQELRNLGPQAQQCLAS